MEDNKINNVILVFEPACDAHWMKDVVQFPNSVAQELYHKNAIIIARPNNRQNEISKYIKMVFLGEPITENEAAFEVSNFSKLITDAAWYFKACKKASSLGSILILYPWYGNTLKGSFIFKVQRWIKFKKAKVILKTDGLLQSSSTNKATLTQRIKDKLQYLFIDKIINENMKVDKDMRKNYPHLSAKLIYIPNCPLNIYHSQKYAPYNDRPNQIIFVGRVHEEQKGSDILLSVWIKIFKKIPGWTLQIVGPCLESYKNLWMKKLGEKEALYSVKWTNDVSPYELIEYFKNSKIVACPSRWESGPIILSEATLCGCSFIGTAVGEIPVLLDGLPGLVNDPEDLKNQILLFVQNPEIASKQAEILFERMKDRRWGIQAKKLSA